ncbi:MAG: diphosphomevalonate decarboxylase [Candidatus Aenigmarchaeota archaeon]|nr:diphosphomevalonate decarboxylase [Candidatus Aenigmarchaeota archaeon]
MKATAVANANIALVKYWGKRDARLILPQNGSISMTCDGLSTKTTVEFSGEYRKDTVIINDEELQRDEKDILGHIEKIRGLAAISHHAKIVSETNFPVAAGLASSASGFAALTMAAAAAAGLELSQKELTVLTRQGSGSASRSICEGFAEWHKGNSSDGSDSYAESIAGRDHWPGFRMIACIVSEAKKKVSSRSGMAQTVATSPYYDGWLKTVEQDIGTIRNGIKSKNFSAVGLTAEQNCLKMHALMLTTKPVIVYWIPATVEIIQHVLAWREEGLECYFTIDGGPQVKVMCLQENEKELQDKLLRLEGVKKTIACRPGDGAALSNSHLF